MTTEIVECMGKALNGWTFDEVAPLVQSGALLLFNRATAYVLLSVNKRTVCIEAISSAKHDDGYTLCAEIVDQCKRGGYTVEAWVMSKSRARLCRRVNMFLTGNERVCENGVRQYHLELNHESRQ